MAPPPQLPPPQPGMHTVHRAPSPSKDTPHVISLAPEFGDGDPSRWPEQGPDMTLLPPDNEKQKIWRRTAAEILAKDLNLWNDQNQFWILEALPTGYGLFQQVTHPKPDSMAARQGGEKSKLRLDRFIFGHATRKIRSAVSLGKHISYLLHNKPFACNCDGCKVAAPRPSAAAVGAESAGGMNPIELRKELKKGRKRRRTSEYENAIKEGLSATLTEAEEAREARDDDDYYEPGEASGSGRAASSPAPTEQPVEPAPAPEPVAAAAPAPPAAAEDASNGTATPAPAPSAADTAADKARARTKAATAARIAKSQARQARNRARLKQPPAWEVEAEDEVMEDGTASTSGAAKEGGDDDYSDVGNKVNVAGRSSSGRRIKASTKALSSLQSDLIGLAAEEDLATRMAPATAEVLAASSTVPIQQVDQDLQFPALARVGELVWVRVPLGPPPQGALANAQLSRWPGIVRSRTIVVTGLDVNEEYRIELLGMSPEDTLDGVRGENVTPWTGYIPANTEYLDQEMFEDDGLKPGETKKRWAAIQGEGWDGVANAFKKAHRIAKAYAAIQIRPIPSIRSGTHLALSSSLPPTSLANLTMQRARSRYLSYDHIVYGPEILHVGDYVRLSPTAELEASVAAQRSSPKSSWPISPVMRISSLYRGGAGSPLIARGLIFEYKELPLSSLPKRASQADVEASLWGTARPGDIVPITQLPPEIVESLPWLLPCHMWRLLTPSSASNTLASLETDVIFSSSVAGRLYPLHPNWPEQQDPKMLVPWLEDARDGVHWWTKEKGKGAKGGWGEEGLNALKVVLAGVSGTERTAGIKAEFGIAGGRTEQLMIAEEQALLRPAVPGAAPIGGSAPRPGDEQATTVAANA
ncbi:hypothetical protein JCM10207_001046 [Rhodosporidiobolus poonsookiae]